MPRSTAPDMLGRNITDGVSSRGVARRERLLDAARDVFLEQGYAGASVNEEVARAGGSLATLYKQFGNKEGLFTAAMERHISTAWAVLEEGRRDHQALEQVLYELGRRMLTLVFEPGVIRLVRGLAFLTSTIRVKRPGCLWACCLVNGTLTLCLVAMCVLTRRGATLELDAVSSSSSQVRLVLRPRSFRGKGHQ